MKLMVSLIRQLQLIGIKTNLESFAITILMEHMLTRNQLPLFLLASKQWGIVYAEQGYIIVTLPLAYSSNKYVVIGQDLDYTNNDTDGYGENVGVTQVTINSIRVSITKGRYLSYCTIGF